MTPRIVPITCPYPGTHVMAYFVDAERPALIDTGGSAHPTAEIAAALAAEGTSLDRIEVIINTHGHWDHAGGNAAVQEASPGVETWIHDLGAHYLVADAPHVEGYATAQARLLFPISPGPATPAFANLFVPGAPADRTFADDDVLDLGNARLRVVHAPGHSEDSVAFYWEETGLLISADAAQGTGSRVGGCPLYFTSTTAARRSIARLLDIPFTELHTGHPFGRLSTVERTTIHDAASGRAFLADSLEALDLLESALVAALEIDQEQAFPSLVSATIANLRDGGRWSPIDDPGLGVPMGAAPTIDTLRRELKAAQ